ncbi:MAG: hypothetical protein LBG28_12885 [Tannerella sp.]|nr:hypothetical protein [Tannerella sp.]
MTTRKTFTGQTLTGSARLPVTPSYRHEVPSPPFVRLCSRTIQNGQRGQRHDYASGIGCRISSEPVNYEVRPLLIINISCPPSYQHLYPRSASETRPFFLTNINGGGG